MTTHYTSKYLALFGICLLAFTAFLDFTIVNTALPFIQKAFKIDILLLQWVSNVFPIILSMTMIAVGKIGDIVGRKQFFYFGVFLFGASALLAGFSPNIHWLIFFRGVQALGASITFIVSSSLLSEVYPENERAWAIGIYGGVTGAGLMLGPFFGGILIGALDWRWVFWVNIPIIAIGLFCCFASLKGTSHREKNVHLDWKGLGLLIVGLGLLMYGIVAGAANALSLACIAIGIIFLGILLVLEMKSNHPLLHFEIFKEPLLLLSVISCAIAGVVSYVFMFFDPLYLENVLHLNPYTIGLLIAIIPAAQVVISFGFNYLLKIGLANLLFASCVAPLISAFLHLFFGIHSSLAIFILPFALLGINWGLSNTAMITAVNQTVAPQKIGESIGTIATIWNFAGSVLLALSTVIFHSKKTAFLPAFKTVIGFNLIFLAVVILIAVAVRRKISMKKQHLK
ncbi:MAG: MFS transporter [Parachlamydiales bacterium]|nr:MFS transporter [Parachlamydiales bacterium]